MSDNPERLGSPIDLTARLNTDDSTDSTSVLKKTKAKKRLGSAAPTHTIQLRSQSKRTSDEDAVPAQGPSKKKAKIAVTGTLGHGENAVQIHPDSQDNPSLGHHNLAEHIPHAPVQPIITQPVKDRTLETSPTSPDLTATQFLSRMAPSEIQKLRTMLGIADVPAMPISQESTQAKMIAMTPPATPVSKFIGGTDYGRSSLTTFKSPDSPSPDTMQAANVGLYGTPLSASKLGAIGAAKKKNIASPSPGYSTPSTSGQTSPISLPERCEVTDPDTQDPMLVDHYHGLPNLKACSVTSMSKEVPTGFYSFSLWREDIPHMDLSLALSCVAFSACGANINPARFDPSKLSYQEYPNNNRVRRELRLGDGPVLCWTTVYVRKSNIVTLTKTGQKSVVGVPHCQEFDRLVATLAMAFRIGDFKTNFFQGGLSFNTYGYTATGGNFSGRRSGMISGSVGRSTSLGTLSNSDQVFVFDCREWENLSLDSILMSLGNLPGHLPIEQKMQQLDFDVFEGEIPAGSCAAIAHTVNVSREAREQFAMNFNIQYVFLLGTPISD